MKRFLVFPVVLTFLSFLLISSVAGSPFVLLHQKDGVATDDLFGSSVAGAGDVDGDGTADFIVGAPEADPNGIIASGSVYVYSGTTGTLIYQIDGSSRGDFLGTSVAGGGDINGDGRADFMVGAPYTDSGGLIDIGTVYIYSGIDGSLLYRLTGSTPGNHFGSSMAGIGDINSDGKADFIIVGGGSVFVYSGATGASFHQISPPTYVNSVAGMGDVNGDGKPDFLVGTPSTNSVFIYSGETADLIRQIDGSTVGGSFGYAVAGVGDINGDSQADFLVGAPYANPGIFHIPGSAFVYSGADGAVLYQKIGLSDSTFFGSSVAGAGDVDGDGRPDFIIGAPWARSGFFGANAGAIFVYSGSDGSTLFQLYGAPYDGLGQSVATAGDVNGNGRDDFIAGAPGSQTGINRPGSAFVYGLLCPVIKGDMNRDSTLSSSDVALMVNCVFLRSGICTGCFADVNCDGLVTPLDVILELYAVFLSRPFPC